MSAMILPSRLLLKPDRAWPGARPRGDRLRPGSWPELLRGMALGRRRCCCTSGPPCPGCQHCLSCDIPLSLTLTDSGGALTITSPGPPSPPHWSGQHTVTATCRAWLGPTGFCNVAAAASGPVMICYQMGCDPDGSLTLGRTFGGISDDCVHYSLWDWSSGGTTNCDASGLPCCTARGTSSGTAFPTTCGTSFAITFTMAQTPGQPISDPCSGSVTVVA